MSTTTDFDGVVEACKQHIDDKHCTSWPRDSWTVKGDGNGLDRASTWLAKEIWAVLNKMETQ